MIRLAQRHDKWVIGFEDETWWSRVAQPHLHAWSADDEQVQLEQQEVAKDDPDPKALACYGLLLRGGKDTDSIMLRFADGRPQSSLTTQFLDYCCEHLAVQGKQALLLIWDNASWHTSKAVRDWIRKHNQTVKAGQKIGVRLVVCFLPSKSPWLNPIEPKWVHGKRRVLEPARLLSADELEQRVYAALNCTPQAHLSNPALLS